MKRFFCTVLVLSALVLTASPVTLVKDGKAAAVIVLDDRPTAAAQMAAFEINYLLKLISGTALKVVKAADSAEKGAKIIITSKLPRKVSGEFWKVACEKGNIILSGQDSPDHRTVDYRKPETFPAVEFAFNGTLFAAYQFLEDALGVRFFGPEEIDVCYTPARTVTVSGTTKEYVPKMDAFRISTCYYGRKIPKRNYILWQLRWRQCDFFGRANHNQYSIYFKHWGVAKRKGFDTMFIDKRPELFAQGYEGKYSRVDPILQTNYPGDRDIPPQLCYSNPDTVKYYANEVMTYFRGGNVKGGWRNHSATIPEDKTLLPRYEGKPFFYPIQGGDTGGFCLCARCRSRSNDENVSNAKFKFIADVANEVAKKNPAAGVSTLAYIQTLSYPDQVVLPPNVAVQLCLTYYNWYHPAVRKHQYGIYKKWIAKEGRKRPLFLWLYTFGPSWDANIHFSKYKPFPGFYPHLAAELMKEFAADGIRGIFTETEMRHLKLEAYLLLRLAIDPTLDTQSIIDDFFVKYYGPAAGYMKEFYAEIEKAYLDPANIPAEWLKDPDVVIGPKGKKHPYWGTGITSAEINWGKMGNPARMKKLKALMKKAEAAVRDHKLFAARLDLFKRNTWNMALEGEKEYQRQEMLRKNPPPLIVPAKVGVRDWKKISARMERSRKFSSLDTRKNPAAGSFGMAYDDKNIYLEYKDALKPFPELTIWKENIDVFFVNGSTMYQISVAPDGEVFNGKYTITGQKVSALIPAEFDIRVVSKPSAGGWLVRMTIPWKELGAKAETPLGMNIYRTWREGSSAWTPVFNDGYVRNFPYYGKVVFFPLTLGSRDFKCVNRSAYIVEDGSHGKVGAMMTNASWTLQCYIPDCMESGRKYEVWVTVRGDFAPESLIGSSNIGVYDTKARKIVMLKKIPVKSINGKKYHRIMIGSGKLSPDMYLYVGGVSPKAPQNRIYLKNVVITAVR